MNLPSELSALLDELHLVTHESVQALWSGYGEIIRCKNTQNNKSYIVKAVMPQNAGDHPRGWNTTASHKRKLKSYQVEASFYRYYAHLTDVNCKVPELVTCKISDKFTLLVMEDLDNAGYANRVVKAKWDNLAVAIKWLAYFHAKFMGNSAQHLWPVGTYWHLDTRHDELDSMPDSDYKSNARMIDHALNSAKFQTLVHGDAKFENLCFNVNHQEVAAVDFQYIGRGSGVKDLAYLAGSCLDQQGLVEFDGSILDTYLKYLNQALKHYKIDVNFDEVSDETKLLYPIAWADFYRFLLGWNPQSWKVCDYLKQKAAEGLVNVQKLNN